MEQATNLATSTEANVLASEGGFAELLKKSFKPPTEERQRALASGFDFHLTKPADPAELQRLLAGGGGVS